MPSMTPLFDDSNPADAKTKTPGFAVDVLLHGQLHAHIVNLKYLIYLAVTI